MPKPSEKFDPAEKREMERMRRWKVLIQDIEIQNTSGEPFDPFIQFIIGGDFFVTTENPH